MVRSLLDRMLHQTPAGRRPLRAAEVEALLRDAGDLDLEGYRRFSDRGYGRNRVALTEHFELVVICWRPGQASDIHDHAHSLCAYLVVEGTMSEEVYRPRDEETAQLLEVRRYGAGEIALVEGSHLHRILNEAEEDLVTIHLYTPPMGDAVRLYRPASAAAGSEHPPLT